VFKKLNFDIIYERGFINDENLKFRHLSEFLHDKMGFKYENTDKLDILIKNNFKTQKVGWHLDATVSNLIICIKEPGTFILIDNVITQLKKVNCYLVIGVNGIKSYGLFNSL